jgi:hypothetical protein
MLLLGRPMVRPIKPTHWVFQPKPSALLPFCKPNSVFFYSALLFNYLHPLHRILFYSSHFNSVYRLIFLVHALQFRLSFYFFLLMHSFIRLISFIFFSCIFNSFNIFYFSSHAYLVYFRITFHYLLLSYAYLNFAIKYTLQSRVLWS